MASVNKVILVGNLGADPELRYTSNGAPVATFRIATNETWINRDGQKEEKVEWHRIVAWGKLAEICGEYLHKGSQVYIEGRIRSRSWEDRDGNKRYITEIWATNMQMLGAPRRDMETAPETPSPDSAGPDIPEDDDIPF